MPKWKSLKVASSKLISTKPWTRCWRNWTTASPITKFSTRTSFSLSKRFKICSLTRPRKTHLGHETKLLKRLTVPITLTARSWIFKNRLATWSPKTSATWKWSVGLTQILTRGQRVKSLNKHQSTQNKPSKTNSNSPLSASMTLKSWSSRLNRSLNRKTMRSPY
jgi:hypothetical protein